MITEEDIFKQAYPTLQHYIDEVVKMGYIDCSIGYQFDLILQALRLLDGVEKRLEELDKKIVEDNAQLEKMKREDNDEYGEISLDRRISEKMTSRQELQNLLEQSEKRRGF